MHKKIRLKHRIGDASKSRRKLGLKRKRKIREKEERLVVQYDLATTTKKSFLLITTFQYKKPLLTKFFKIT